MAGVDATEWAVEFGTKPAPDPDEILRALAVLHPCDVLIGPLVGHETGTARLGGQRIAVVHDEESDEPLSISQPIGAQEKPATWNLVGWRQHYQQQLSDPDRVRRAVAREQLNRLKLGSRQRSWDANRRNDPQPARVVLIRPYRAQLQALIEASGNTPMRWRGTEAFDTGHQPFHDSKSGSCLMVDLRTGFWWCRSCRKAGGSIEWLAAMRGVTPLRAAVLLRQQFGDGAP
jgi:hypothetical protein